MERLTRRSADGRACFKPHLYGQMNKDVCDRLAAYEDTGLEPEEIRDGYLYCKHIKPFAMELYNRYWTAFDGPPEEG